MIRPPRLGASAGRHLACPRRPSSEPRPGRPSSWRRPCWCKGASRLDAQVREGVPAEELVKVAAERQVICIVLGHRGSALRHRLRRLLLGSTTAQVLRKAPCPVLLVPLPSAPTDLVACYAAAITRELS